MLSNARKMRVLLLLLHPAYLQTYILEHLNLEHCLSYLYIQNDPQDWGF